MSKYSASGVRYVDSHNIFHAIGRNDIDDVLHYIEDVNDRDELNYTPLMRACNYGYFDIAKLLVSNKSEINARNNIGYSALLMCSRERRLEYVELLIQNGADVNIIDNKGWSPIIAASYDGFAEVAHLLVRNGANINYQIPEQLHTALMFACHNGHIEVVNVLLANGADPNIKSKDGQTALEFASASKNKQDRIVMDITMRNQGNLNRRDLDTAIAFVQKLEEIMNLLVQIINFNEME